MNRQVEIYIDELILTGFLSTDRHRIGEAVKSELTRLISEKGLQNQTESGGLISQIDAATIHIKDSKNARTTCIQIAQSIFGGLNK
ncbi:MAG: hypothetical protein R2750_01960 [Bacteroidales bacterium]